MNRREDRKRGQETTICTNTLFLVVSCCEPHWLCVLWVTAMSRLARYRSIRDFHICMCCFASLFIL